MSNILARDSSFCLSPQFASLLQPCIPASSSTSGVGVGGDLFQEGRVSVLPLYRVEGVGKGRVDEGVMGGKEERKQK